jgi:chromosome segregation ATPase
MKTADYINSLNKENEELKELCKSHINTIRLQKREIFNLNNIILKKDKKIKNFENDQYVIGIQRELENVKNELSKLKIDYLNLQNKNNEVDGSIKKTQRGKNELSKLKSEYSALKGEYDRVVKENAEYKRIFEEADNESDSE